MRIFNSLLFKPGAVSLHPKDSGPTIKTMIKFFRRIRQQLVTENKTRKYLVYAIGEIVLVVIGILIALQLNNLNEIEKINETEYIYLNALHDEFTNNLKEVERVMELNAKGLAYAHALLGKMGTDDPNFTEKIFDFYYKNQVRYFQYRGIRIPGQVTFPETAAVQKQYDFNYTNNQNVTLTLDLNFETYYPSFDDHSTFYKGNTIGQFNLRNSQKDNGTVFDDTWIDKDYPPSE